MPAAIKSHQTRSNRRGGLAPAATLGRRPLRGRDQLCPNGSTCELNAASAGYAIGVASDTDAAGNDIDGAACPSGLTRSAWDDDGQGSGQGLGSCMH